MQSLYEMIQELAQKRADTQAAKVDFAAHVEWFENSPEYTALKDAKTNAILAQDELESRIKEYAVKSYDGNQHPHPKIDIDITHPATVTYDLQKAHEWALTHNTGVLDLNKKEFEKIAKAGKVPAEIAVVSQVDVLRATIATKL